MTPDDQKTIDRLVQAIDQAYNSTARMFWRGFLWGLARGLGATVGLAIVIGFLIFLFDRSGLGERFTSIYEVLEQISQSLNSLSR